MHRYIFGVPFDDYETEDDKHEYYAHWPGQDPQNLAEEVNLHAQSLKEDEIARL